jgi:hypothetical protein
LVIKRYRPWQRALWLVTGVLLLVSSGYVLYAGGRSSGRAECALVGVYKDRLDQAQQLARENAELRAQVATLERSAQIEKAAYADVDQQLKRLQGELLQLREELAFYRGVVNATEPGSGLKVQSLTVQRQGPDRVYHYRLVLTQFSKSVKVIEGTVDLSLVGEQEGRSVRLSLQDLSGEASQAVSFRFRNFQQVEGAFTLPSGFVPRQVLVRLNAKGSRRKKVERAFDWHVATGAWDT